MVATSRLALSIALIACGQLACAAKLPFAPSRARQEQQQQQQQQDGSSAGGSSSGRGRSAITGSQCGRRRRPRGAFQVSEWTFELDPREYAGGKPYLLQFKGKGDDYCEQMEPLKEQLREELGVEIRDFEVWYDSKNLELLQRLDKGRCGGVPFFYNKRSRRYICGATTYDNLRRWALCEPCEPILPPPNINDNREVPQNQIQKFMTKVKRMAMEKMQGSDDDDEDEDDEDD